MRGGFAAMGDNYIARKRAGITQRGPLAELGDGITWWLDHNRFMEWFDHRFHDWAAGKQTKFQGFITLSILWLVGLMPLWVVAAIVTLAVIYL